MSCGAEAQGFRWRDPNTYTHGDNISPKTGAQEQLLVGATANFGYNASKFFSGGFHILRVLLWRGDLNHRLSLRLLLRLLLIVAPACAWAGQAARVPDLPDIALEAVSPAVRVKVKEAGNGAQANASDAVASGKVAMLLHANGALQEAEPWYARAAALDRSSFRWMYLLGLVRAEQGNCGAAVTAFRDALRLDKNYTPAQFQLGECLLGSGNWDEATRLYDSILAKDPGSAQAHYGRALIFNVRKEFKKAAAELQRALELAPDFGAAHYALANVYQRLGKQQESLREMSSYQGSHRSANAADPIRDELRALNGDPVEKVRRGVELAREGKLDDAMAAENEALQLAPQLAAAHIELITICGRLRRDAEAEEHYHAAVRLDPRNAEAHLRYGMLNAEQDKFAQAEEAFRKALELDPELTDARLNLGYALEAQEKLPEALEQFETLLRNNPRDGEAHFNAGRILINQEKYQAGIEHLLKSVDAASEESRPACLYALGAAYARSGGREKGLDYLKQAKREATAHGQSKLVEAIEADLRELQAQNAAP